MNEKTVGMLAKFTGVSVHTIKYYEKIGLLSSTRREHSNYRSYDIRACTDIYECMKYKNLGFALKEVGNLIKEADSEAIDNLLKKMIRGNRCFTVRIAGIKKTCDGLSCRDGRDRKETGKLVYRRNAGFLDQISDE